MASPSFLRGLGMELEVKDNKIIWGDSEYQLPPEVQNKPVERVFCTATSGMVKSSGIFLRANGKSAELAAAPDGHSIAGHIVGEIPERGRMCYLREQMQPKAPFNYFFLVSVEKIENDVNWISVEFKDGTLLRLCPFTLQYEIE